MKHFGFKTICPILTTIILTIFVGCGGGTKASNPTPQGKPIDPSGNWRMTFTDSNNQMFLLSALFNQTGSVVTALDVSEVGNPTTFQCVTQPDISMSSGTVQNVSTFSGDLSGNFGTIHFTSTLNDAGSHAVGTYTVTPGAGGNCLGVSLTGNFTADEIPSMTGNWTGTVTCTANCPIGSTTGNLTMSLTQNDANGEVTGSYTVTGLPAFSTGNIVPDVNNLLSGASIQQKFLDNNGTIYALAGGPLNSFGTAGVGLDRTFHGNFLIGDSTGPLYSVSMSH